MDSATAHNRPPDRPYLQVERRGHVLVVTLDRPGRLNAYDGPGLQAIGSVWRELDDDPELRVGVLTGAGGEFCAGADIAAAATGGFDDPPYPEVAEGLAAKPVIAAVEGRCLGGGLMIATGCHLRLAGRSARFGLPEARWNLPAQWLGALARQILPAHLLELALLADRQIDAERMAAFGFLNRVVDDGHALEEALAWADVIAAQAPAAVRAFTELATKGTWLSPEEALALGHRQAIALTRMADTIEGATAFAERRPPRWQDR